ncbi:hypothetical protein UCMB321_2608 [Pseudomonas batumici]|uniref:Uncharacterized protein n=1 Tax=Pseudomonas batumici TaxID=226910 RepID=A0A0C2ECQ2_9PSED|nr:hypothetical protein UCMB321_2608 [Pseudomonas batumici]
MWRPCCQLEQGMTPVCCTSPAGLYCSFLQIRRRDRHDLL